MGMGGTSKKDKKSMLFQDICEKDALQYTTPKKKRGDAGQVRWKVGKSRVVTKRRACTSAIFFLYCTCGGWSSPPSSFLSAASSPSSANVTAFFLGLASNSSTSTAGFTSAVVLALLGSGVSFRSASPPAGPTHPGSGLLAGWCPDTSSGATAAVLRMTSRLNTSVTRGPNVERSNSVTSDLCAAYRATGTFYLVRRRMKKEELST